MTGLWRNRDFTLLWMGQCLSEFGNAIASLALPLLVLAVTGSPLQAGLVGTIGQTTRLVCRLPSGIMVDPANPRRAMLVCDAVRLASSVLAAIPEAVTLLLAPACNATLFGHQASIPPDRLQGRALSVIFLYAHAAAAVAPLLAGLLVPTWHSAGTTALFTAAVGGSALAATFGRGLHKPDAHRGPNPAPARAARPAPPTRQR